ncbi:MAG TPA: heat-inducible transcriptional repressor HrcA [Chitinispirillaceae bacterium]|nr:heat-inducible transcriptional repressor HrcA [Chitinispirillaceae bacterium]
MAILYFKAVGMESDFLSEREHQVLEAVIRNYILSASPTSSRYLSKQNGFDLSPASIRNVMSDLEERGLIAQPHTSAGRIPTDKGYRYYVDCVMTNFTLPDEIKSSIRKAMVTVDQSDLHLLLEAASRALSRTTNQLGVILAPRIYSAVLRQLHVFQIQAQRYLLNIALDAGFIKTMVVEFKTEIPQERLECACRIISSKFEGKTLLDMCNADDITFKDIPDLELGIIRLLVPSIKKILENTGQEQVYTEGQTNVLLQPEFFNRDAVSTIIEIVEEKKMLMHLIETPTDEDGVLISIGGENQGLLQSFSVIKTNYRVGNMVGSLGVIGPKRMPYPFLVSAVEYTAKVLGEIHS